MCVTYLASRPSFFVFFHSSKGYDCIVARGCVEPDPSKDVVIKIEGKPVRVPQGKPKAMAAYKGSRFSNSEYLVSMQNTGGGRRSRVSVVIDVAGSWLGVVACLWSLMFHAFCCRWFRSSCDVVVISGSHPRSCSEKEFPVRGAAMLLRTGVASEMLNERHF